MKKPDSVYHLSHTDMDGFACQFLTSHCFETVTFQNSNYGDEITARLKLLFDAMLLDNAASILLLITDLNLTIQQCRFIEAQIEKLRGFKRNTTFTIQLLDHHGSGAEAAKAFEWYSLDTSRSATKITFEWLKKRFDCTAVDPYRAIVEAIDAADIWRQEAPEFEFGKVLMGAIAASREMGKTLFEEEDRTLKFHLIRAAAERLGAPDAHIRLDDAMHGIKKSFFREAGEDDTLDNLVAAYMTGLLTARKEALTIRYRDKTGILTYGLPNISVVGNAFLRRNPDIDFILNLAPNGTIGLRSADRVDVSEIASTLAGGGGHPNASGGRINDFKETYDYNSAKRFIESLIASKTKEEA